MTKALKITLIALLSVFIIALIVFLVLVLNGNLDLTKFRFTSIVSKELVFDKEYDNVFEKIIIEADAANINIRNNDEDKIKVIIYGDKERTEVIEDTTLTIKTTTKPCNFFCINTRISKIDILVPTSYQNLITINDKYGDIKGETVYSLEAFTDYGDIKFDSIVDYFKLETDFGDIKIDKINISKNSSATTDFGSIKIGETNEVNITAHTDLGDKKINNNKEDSDINLNLQTDFGDIKVNY